MLPSAKVALESETLCDLEKQDVCLFLELASERGLRKSSTSRLMPNESLRLTRLNSPKMTLGPGGRAVIRLRASWTMPYSLLRAHRDAIAWLPSLEELRSDQMYVYPWSIYCHETRPTTVELIFSRPKDKMVFFMNSKG